jgi:hypothetical protein
MFLVCHGRLEVLTVSDEVLKLEVGGWRFFNCLFQDVKA